MSLIFGSTAARVNAGMLPTWWAFSLSLQPCQARNSLFYLHTKLTWHKSRSNLTHIQLNPKAWNQLARTLEISLLLSTRKKDVCHYHSQLILLTTTLPTKLASIMVLSVTLLFVPITLLDYLWQLLRLSREMEAHLLQ